MNKTQPILNKLKDLLEKLNASPIKHTEDNNTIEVLKLAINHIQLLETNLVSEQIKNDKLSKSIARISLTVDRLSKYIKKQAD